MTSRIVATDADTPVVIFQMLPSDAMVKSRW